MLELSGDDRADTREVLIKQLNERAAAAAREAKREKKPEAFRAYKKKAFFHWKALLSCRKISGKDKLRLLLYALFPSFSEKLMLRVYGRV